MPQIKTHKTVEQIAKKHRLDVSFIQKQLEMGEPIEHEHTKDHDLAKDIALQHLDEIPDYYTRLKKMEADAKKHHKKFKDVKEETKSGDEGLHDWFGKSKSSDGKKGWVQLGGKWAGKPCARQPGQTSTPKCGSSKMKRSLSKDEEETARRRKNIQDPNQPQKTGGAKPTNVRTEDMDLQEVKDKPGKGSGKKDACYHKVKSRYSVWPSAYACVPEKTSKSLTKEGWKGIDELNIGDDILTYNIQKDELEFKPIINLHRYKNVKTNIIKSGNNGFIFESTDNHKWVVKLPETTGNRICKYERINDKSLIETSEILLNKNNKHLVVSAPYFGGTPTKSDKIFKYGSNWIKYILDITQEQRQSWLFSAIVYDGNQQKIQRLTENDENVNELDWMYTSSCENKQTFGLKQKDIQHRDAFLLAAFLNSGLVTWKKSPNKNIYSCHYTSNKRFKNTSNFKLIKENISNVWCPETENGTWVMMQETNGNGIITITGNSGALVKCRKVGADNWGTKSEATMHEEERYCPLCDKRETRSECSYGEKAWDKVSVKDEEYSMVRSELKTIMNAAKRLNAKVGKGEGNLEAWVQSKITKAADYIDTAADYVDSGEMEEQKLTDKIIDEILNEKCWPGYKKKGMKTMFGKRYPNCVKAENVSLEDVDGNTFAEVIDLIKPDPIRGTASKPKKIEEMVRLQSENGNVVAITLSWRGKYYAIQMFFPQSKLPSRQEIAAEIQKIYPDSRLVHHSVSEIQPGQPIIRVGYQGGTSAFPGPSKKYVKPYGEQVEFNEDWQSVNRKDKTDGLSQAAVNAYRRENPGSKLQTAVTEKNPTGKRADRRTNFCRRMKGMKSKLTSAKTSRDPDSRINKALRRWNCN